LSTSHATHYVDSDSPIHSCDHVLSFVVVSGHS